MAEVRKKKPIVRSRAFVERQVTFYSYDAQQILLGFGRLAGAMYRLGISLRAYLPPERVTSLTDALYEELITPLEHEIADDLARLQEQARQTNTVQVDYSNPVQRTLRIFYPQALRILALAQNLDTLVCYLNPLWFARAITDAQYFELKEKYRNTLVEIANRIKNLATVQMEEAKAQVEAKEQAKAEKAKARKTKARAESPPEDAATPAPAPEAADAPAAEVIPLMSATH